MTINPKNLAGTTTITFDDESTRSASGMDPQDVGNQALVWAGQRHDDDRQGDQQ